MDSAATLATAPDAYRFWIEDAVRFADLDPVGHVNNNAIGVYFESVRVALFREIGVAIGAEGPTVAVARVAIDFRNELLYPARFRVGARVGRIGRTSATVLGAIFHAESCVATSEVVCVLIDGGTHRPIEIPDATRARLAAYA